MTTNAVAPLRSRDSIRLRPEVEPVSIGAANSRRETVRRGQRPGRALGRPLSIPRDREWELSRLLRQSLGNVGYSAESGFARDCVVGLVGVPSPCNFNGLLCPASHKAPTAGKREFSRLSNRRSDGRTPRQEGRGEAFARRVFLSARARKTHTRPSGEACAAVFRW
jgi:hypothetical protein